MDKYALVIAEIAEFVRFDFVFLGFGLRSVSGDVERRAERSAWRIAAGAQRPPPSHRRKPAAHAANCGCSLVTSAFL